MMQDGDELSFAQYQKLFVSILKQLNQFAMGIEAMVLKLEEYLAHCRLYENYERLQIMKSYQSKCERGECSNECMEGHAMTKIEKLLSNDSHDATEMYTNGMHTNEWCAKDIEHPTSSKYIKNQERYIKALREEWNHIKNFLQLYIAYIKIKNNLNEYELDYNSENAPSEEMIEHSYNELIHTHTMSTDFADLQVMPSSKIFTPYQIPILNVHKLVQQFRIKVFSLYKLKDTKKSTLMTCSCRRFIALCHRILSYPESIFKILVPMTFDPKDVRLTYERNSSKDNKTEVDLIQDELLWFKFKESRKKKIYLVYEGMNESNQKCVTTIADELMSAARLHPFHYRVPRVCFKFLNGLNIEIAKDLAETSIVVQVENDRELFPKDYNEAEVKELKEFETTQSYIEPFIASSTNLLEELFKTYTQANDEKAESHLNYQSQIKLPILASFEEKFILRTLLLYPKVVNFDVTTLIVLSADVSHGYQSPDQSTPLHQYNSHHTYIIPRLMSFLKGRKWIISQQAKNDFLKILYTVAGKHEIQRAEEILQQTRVVANDPTDRIQKLTDISQQHRNIVGTGDRHHAITVTSNLSLVNKIHKNGVHPSFYIFNNYSIRLGLRTEFYRKFLQQQSEKKSTTDSLDEHACD